MGKRLKRSRNSIRETPGAKHLITALVIIVLVMVIGVSGYQVIAHMSFHDALYTTVTTITTVGFREVRPLGADGQYFTIFLIMVGFTSVLFFLTGLFELILGEYFGNFWRRREMEKEIGKLRKHYIVCGYGRVGSHVASELEAHGNTFVVVESDAEAYKRCVENGHLCIRGSAVENHILEEAGITTAAGLVSTLRSDADNLYVVLTARSLNKDILLISRVEMPEAESKLKMVGVDKVISPHRIAGRQMANLLFRPGVYEFIDVGMARDIPDYQISEVVIREGSSLSGKTIKESRLHEITGVTILSIKKVNEDAYTANPPSDTRIEYGDKVLLIGTTEQLAKVNSQAHIVL